MKQILHLLTMILIFSPSAFSQEPAPSARTEKTTQKELAVLDFERQIRDIPYAAIRIRNRHLVAEWLWASGQDDTGRAEAIASAAFEDYFKNKAEIPVGFSVLGQLQALVDRNAPSVGKKMREKYVATGEDNARGFADLLRQEDGDRRAVAAAVQLLSGSAGPDPDLSYLLITLDQQNSPHLNNLLSAILTAEEAGRRRFATHTFESLAGYFLNTTIPSQIRRRYIALAIARARSLATLSSADQLAYYRIFQRFWPDITTHHPEMLEEAGTIMAFLNSRVSSSIREANEIHDRIRNSQDKLSATVSEAERAQDDVTKYGLYRSAARLALEQKRFTYAVDLMEKAADIDRSGKAIETEKTFRRGMHDEFYSNVVAVSLDNDEPDAAHYAIRRMTLPLTTVESLTRVTKYGIERGDIDTARRSHDQAVKLVNQTDNSPRMIAALLRMIPPAERLDSGSLSEVIKLASQRINDLPTLNVEDKPETKNYRDYVSSVVVINYDLLAAVSHLVKTNRASAEDLASRIKKNEIKFIGDFVVSTTRLDSIPEPNAANDESTN